MVSRFTVTKKRFRAGGRGAKAAARNKRRRSRRKSAPRGTRFMLTLSEPATVRIAIRRSRPGRRAGRRCAKPTRRNRRARKCVRQVRSGSLPAVKRGAGRSSIAFSGRRRSRRLAPGRYTATIVARDAAGNASRPRTVRFQIVR